MKKINEININQKTIILRCDFNVPIENGIIQDDRKIRKSLLTINYILDHQGKLIILSHFGRVKEESDKAKNTLRPVAVCLEKMLNQKVTFVTDIKEIKNEKIYLLENTRFTDLPEEKESLNDLELAKQWANLGDIFCFDAFGSAHRIHSSTVGIANFLPTCLGFLVLEEIENLSKVVDNPQQPFVVIMGGAKIDDKLTLIRNLLPKCAKLLLGGGIANSFLFASNIEVGDSLKCEDTTLLKEISQLKKDYQAKIILPSDCLVLKNNLVLSKSIDEVAAGEKIFDIGPKTINYFNDALANSKTVFFNGTLGLCEDERFSGGTKKILDSLEKVTTIIGGGDTISAVNKLKKEHNFILSSGGGASLEYIADGSLPVLVELEKLQSKW